MSEQIDTEISKTNFYIRLINLSIRGVSLLAKLLFIIFSGKFLAVELIGEFNILTSTIVICVYILGFEFYTFNTREIINSSNCKHKITNQLIMHILSYVLLFPIFILFFIGHYISYDYILIFYFILISEHICWELTRIYIALDKQLLSNSILSLKTIWILIVLIDWLILDKTYTSILPIIKYWALNVGATLILGLVLMRKNIVLKNYNLDVPWIIKGLKTSGLFFIGALAYKIIQFSDRYLIDYFLGLKQTGIYTFFFSIINGIDILLYTLITMFVIPKIITNANNKKLTKIIREYTRDMLIGISIITILMIIMIPYLLKYINNDIYLDNLNIFYLLIFSSIIMNISQIPHYVLYAKKQDFLLMKINIFIAILNVLLNIYLIPRLGIKGAVISTIICFILMLIIKLKNTYKYSKL